MRSLSGISHDAASLTVFHVVQVPKVCALVLAVVKQARTSDSSLQAFADCMDVLNSLLSCTDGQHENRFSLPMLVPCQSLHGSVRIIKGRRKIQWNDSTSWAKGIR